MKKRNVKNDGKTIDLIFLILFAGSVGALDFGDTEYQQTVVEQQGVAHLYVFVQFFVSN